MTRILLAATLACLAAVARAETVEVRMLNRGPTGTMVYEPDFVALQPGDTLQFRVGDRSHNAASIDGMMPEGATRFVGKIDAEISVTFDRPGLYGIKCSPHYTMGMVMLVRVGDAPVTLDLLDRAGLPDAARKRFREILDRTAATGR